MKDTKNITGRQIPFLNLKSEYLSIKRQIDKAVSRVLLSSNYILSAEVENFEKELASFVGTKYCVGVASGTDALTLALKALSLKAGDGVIVPANVYPSAFGVALSGLKLQLCDVDPNTLNLSAESLKKACTKITKVIVMVHLYGNPVNLDEVVKFAKERSLYIIEDCAQSIGATFNGKKVGSFGDISCFSFYPTKNLGAHGDGGAVLTSSRKYYRRVKRLRMYGESTRYRSVEVGHNSRLDEIQAAILRAKLPYINEWNDKRRRLAQIYKEQLKELPIKLLKEESNGRSIYHLFVICTNKRKKLMEFLKKEGIQTSLHYPIPIHMTKSFKYLGHQRSDFPVSEEACRKVLSLPLYPSLRVKDVKEICKIIRKFYDKTTKQ